MAASGILSTPRLTIAPFAVARHLTPRYVAWLNDQNITRYSEQRHGTHTLATCTQYAASFEGTPHHFWALVARDDQLGHIGNMNAYVDPAAGVADVGILIGDTRAHGAGYATEAWLAVCDYLLRTAGLRKVTAGTLAVNEPMLRLMARTGMAEDGRRIRHRIWGDTAVDVVHAAFFREDWLRRHPRPPYASETSEVTPP